MGVVERRNAVLYLRLPANLKNKLMHLAQYYETSLTDLAAVILQEWVDQNDQSSQAEQEGKDP